MKREDFDLFLNKKIRIAVIFGNDPKPFYYTGHILDVGDDVLLFKDKYGNSISVAVANVVKIEEMTFDGQNSGGSDDE